MVVSPISKEMFLVDVKGLYRMNPWLIKRKPQRANLFYIFAYVPADEPNQFFIMTQQQATQLIESELSSLKRADSYPVTGFGWKLALPHQNAWGVLPK